jgi:hypothetical protein
MTKPRRFVSLQDVELVVRLTPAQVRDHLLAIAEAALWNSANSEEQGTPQQRDQEVIARLCKHAAQGIEAADRENWKGLRYGRQRSSPYP